MVTSGIEPKCKQKTLKSQPNFRVLKDLQNFEIISILFTFFFFDLIISSLFSNCSGTESVNRLFTINGLDIIDDNRCYI